MLRSLPPCNELLLLLAGGGKRGSVGVLEVLPWLVLSDWVSGLVGRFSNDDVETIGCNRWSFNCSQVNCFPWVHHWNKTLFSWLCSKTTLRNQKLSWLFRAAFLLVTVWHLCNPAPTASVVDQKPSSPMFRLSSAFSARTSCRFSSNFFLFLSEHLLLVRPDFYSTLLESTPKGWC